MVREARNHVAIKHTRKCERVTTVLLIRDRVDHLAFAPFAKVNADEAVRCKSICKQLFDKNDNYSLKDSG